MKIINKFLLASALLTVGTLSSCSLIENIGHKEAEITYKQSKDNAFYTIDCKGKYNNTTLSISPYEDSDLTIVAKKAFNNVNLETLEITVGKDKRIEFNKKAFANSVINELKISGEGSVFFSYDCFKEANIEKVSIDATEVSSFGRYDDETENIGEITVTNGASVHFNNHSFTRVDLYDASLKCEKSTYLFVHDDNSSYQSAFTNSFAYFDEDLKVGQLSDEEIKYTTAIESGFFTTKYHHAPLAYTTYLPKSIEAVPAGLFGDEYANSDDKNENYTLILAGENIPQIVDNCNSRFTFGSDIDINLALNESYTIEEVLSKNTRSVEDIDYNNQDESTISDNLSYKPNKNGYTLSATHFDGDSIVIGKHNGIHVNKISSGSFKGANFKKVEIYTYKSETLEVSKNAFKEATIDELVIKGAGEVIFNPKSLRYSNIKNLVIEKADVLVKKVEGESIFVDSLTIKDNGVAKLENCFIDIVNLYDGNLNCTKAELVLVHNDNSKYTSANTNGIIAFEEGLKVSENGIEQKYTAIEARGLFENKLSYVPIASEIYLPSTTKYVPQRMLGTKGGSEAKLYIATSNVNISPIMNNNFESMDFKTNVPVLGTYLSNNNIDKELVSETNPTCVDKGVKTYYVDTLDFTIQEFTDALGHTYDDGVITSQPTCQKEGIKKYVCSMCQYVYEEKINKINHNFEIFIDHTTETCQHNGYDLYKCLMCDETEQKNIINKLPHTEVIDNAVSPSCTHTGLTEGKHCSECGEIIIKQEIVEKIDHNYSTEIDHKDSTCKEKGYTTYQCTMCDASKVIELDLLPHTVVIDEATTADCTHTGLTEGKHCSECGEVLLKQEIIPTSDHNDGSYIDGMCDGCGTKVADIEKISSLANFNSIDPHKNYYLSSDIDFSSYTQSKASFFGNLYGNGYSITNLKTPLFIENTGLIDNIVFKNCTISASANVNSDNSAPSANAEQGITQTALICRINNGTINNCVIDSCTFTYNYNVNVKFTANYYTKNYLTTQHPTYSYDAIKIGGFTYNNKGNITKCTIGNITVNSNVNINYTTSYSLFQTAVTNEYTFNSTFNFGVFCYLNEGTISDANSKSEAKITVNSNLHSNSPDKNTLIGTSTVNVGSVCVSGNYNAISKAEINKNFDTDSNTHEKLDYREKGRKLTNNINIVN